jgi:hypothetical protein
MSIRATCCSGTGLHDAILTSPPLNGTQHRMPDSRPRGCESCDKRPPGQIRALPAATRTAGDRFSGSLRRVAAMLATLAVLVLTGSFACTFAMMWALQRLSFGHAVLQTARPTRAPHWSASALGPDDDPAFLRELRRRIDLGHFRH